ncbi:AAA family ATPase [Daejeonella sp.]|jgi:exonuclease SbcC|uniref:AAA family ATPase n=1 Tax=Daejeonella sp. TaxID=2805397 RepID=UPI0037C0C249
MKLIKLQLHPFAGTVDKTYHFQDELNVVYGHNEAGKSTIVKALLLVLLEPTDLTKTEFKKLIENYIPIGGDTIKISLAFEQNGAKYELKKSWGANNFSSLNIKGQAPTQNALLVQEELNRLLNLNKSTLRDVIFTTQAKIASTIEEINKNSEIGNSLDQILRGAIFNTAGIVPQELSDKLRKEYDELSLNWDLENDAPIIGSNNKGSYENKRGNGLGEILKIAYQLYDKQNALLFREHYDIQLSEIANHLNQLKEAINTDEEYISLTKPLVESLTKRKEIINELSLLEVKKNTLREAQADWNSINANLPVMTDQLALDNEQLTRLKDELEHARKAGETTIKISQFKNITDLKLKYETTKNSLNALKKVENENVELVKKIHDQLVNAQQELNALESAQKFIVEIHPKKNLEVEIQQGAELAVKTKLLQGKAISLEVSKGFQYSSEDVTIQVKSLTQQITTLNEQITALANELELNLSSFDVPSFEELIVLNTSYNQAKLDQQLAKSAYDNSIVGTSYESLEKEVNELQNLPKTRELTELNKLYNDLVGKIATDKLKIKEFENKLAELTSLYTSLDNLDEIRLTIRQDEQIQQSKLAELPPIEANLDIDNFRIEYKDVIDRLNSNKQKCHEKEIERAIHEGIEPEDLASELHDQIDLLQRLKNQKIEEAKAIAKVLSKLEEILNRVPLHPYQNYENKLAEYLLSLSGGKYSISQNGSLTPHVIRNSTTNLELPIEMLSQGTSGILGLSLRLCMADYYLNDQKGFLAFDDPMVDFDQNRQLLAAQCLQDYASEKQVLVFTCHQTHANLLGGNLIDLNT